MIYTESEIDSLRRFMRVESPLASYARSIRGEAAAQTTTTDGKETTETTYDLLAGADVDNLPQDFVDRLKKANTELAELQKSKKEFAVEKEKLTKAARDQQARADRNYELNRKHNLVDGNGNVTVGSQDAQELAILQNLENELVKQGFSVEIAKAQAKVQYAGYKVLQPEMLKNVGTALSPALATVGDLHATQLLNQAKASESLAPYFAIPEIDKEVNESMAIMVQNGAAITSDTVERLVDMAYGKLERTQTPEKKQETKDKIVNFNTKGTTTAGGGNNPNPPSFRVSGQAPIPDNIDTKNAAAVTFAIMTKGLKKGKQ